MRSTEDDPTSQPSHEPVHSLACQHRDGRDSPKRELRTNWFGYLSAIRSSGALSLANSTSREKRLPKS
jgi:hypothetical protein